MFYIGILIGVILGGIISLFLHCLVLINNKYVLNKFVGKIENNIL